MKTPKPRYAWKPLQRATTVGKDWPEAVITHAMEIYNLDRANALKMLRENEPDEYWLNDIYQVAVHEWRDGITQLNIRRRDGGPILRDWRHFQAIKNELLGPECEAVELYPAESRLTDTSNKFHLWGSRDPTFRFPFGWKQRDVNYSVDKDGPPGIRQRPL